MRFDYEWLNDLVLWFSHFLGSGYLIAQLIGDSAVHCCHDCQSNSIIEPYIVEKIDILVSPYQRER